MRTVIAHEWLTNIAGSELVFKTMAEMFPDAELVVGVADPEVARALLPGRRVRTLLSHRLPLIRSRWHLYAPLLLLLWRVRRIECDLLLVSSHFASHQACRRTPGRAVTYYHSPMRIAWRWDLESGRMSGLRGRLFSAIRPLVQKYDRAAAMSVDTCVANSQETASRIERFYGRESTVVYPPVALFADGEPRATRQTPFYLVLGRLVSYKRTDLAIKACNRLGRRLVIAGDGPERARLRAIAGPTIEFLGRVSEPEKTHLLQSAQALLFPGEEDFGIVPVEAMAAGTPVVAFNRGGATETVTPEVGELFDVATASSLASAMTRLEARELDTQLLRRHAARFDEDQFRRSLIDVIASTK